MSFIKIHYILANIASNYSNFIVLEYQSKISDSSTTVFIALKIVCKRNKIKTRNIFGYLSSPSSQDLNF